MKKSIAFLICCAMFTCCDREIGFIIDPKIAIYVDNFYHEAEIRGVVLRLDNLNVSVINLGDRFGLTKDGKYVYIHQPFVESYSGYSLELEVIIFHELGHALLSKGHIDDHKAIMNTTPNINCYGVDQRTEFINDLFNN